MGDANGTVAALTNGQCNGKVIEVPKGKLWDRVPTRIVLAVVSFFGFFTNYMMRVAMNIAIVDMVAPSNESRTDFPDGQCAGNLSKSLPEVNASDIFDEEDKFPWNMNDQGLILGSFYWSYIVALIPGGLMAQKFGAKLVFGAANLTCATLSILIPLATKMHIAALILVRVLQGMASGTTWPAMNVMASRWIPPTERSKFIAMYFGNSVGTAVTYPLCGVLIARLGWSSAFYVPGAIGLLWCVCWWLLVFDSPDKHPRISEHEKTYIRTAVAPTLAAKQPPVPWRRMATSVPMWALMISNVGSLWIFMTLLTYGPTYIKNVHGLSIEANGLVSGLPNVSRFLAALVFSGLADWLLSSGRCSLTTVRKLATIAGQLIPGALCLLLTNVGCDAIAEVALMTIILAFNGAAASGPLANSVDLAPNFAGAVMGIISLLSMSSGFLVPTTVSGIVGEEAMLLASWRPVFIITAVVSIVSCLVFMVGGSGEVQPWNVPQSPRRTGPPSRELQEMEKIRPEA